MSCAECEKKKNKSCDKCDCGSDSERGDCPVGKECECPLRLYDRCVSYTGCELITTGIKQGDNLQEIIQKMNYLYEAVVKKSVKLQDYVDSLEEKVDKLTKQLKEVTRNV